jgi:predicted esterase
MQEKNIEAKTHGRYLVEASTSGAPMLVGFHGYAELADVEFDRLRKIDGADQWTVVAIQALHRFYRGRSRDVVASWMTLQDRDLAIADNISYTGAVIESVAREYATSQTLVLSGFSQGVAMAYRCATHLNHPVDGLIALGGDVPPELDQARLSTIRSVLLGRGIRDEWYTAENLAQDEERLRSAGVNVEAAVFDGGHEWSAEFYRAASGFLRARKTNAQS